MWKSTSAQNNIFANIETVLVSPQIPENIGLVARVLKNTAFSQLTLVNPQRTPKSFEVAKRARDVLTKAAVVDSLDKAVASSQCVFGTTRRRRDYRVIYDFDAIKPMLVATAQTKKTSIVFGRESTGLTQEEMQRCDYVFTLPGNEDFPSYNLAFSVGIVCYELFNFVRNVACYSTMELAEKGEIESFFSYLEEYLKQYLDKRRLPHALRSLRRLLQRTFLTKNEVALLKSLIVPRTLAKRKKEKRVSS